MENLPYSTNFSIYVKASPLYLIEITISLIFICMNTLLILDLNRILSDIIGIASASRNFTLKKQPIKESKDSVWSNESLVKNNSFKRHQVQTIYSPCRNSSSSKSPNAANSEKLEALLSVTPSGFVRKQKEENSLKERITSILKLLGRKESKHKEVIKKCIDIVHEQISISSESVFSNEPAKTTFQKNVLDPVLYDLVENIFEFNEADIPGQFRSLICKKLLERERSVRCKENVSNSSYNCNATCKITFKKSSDEEGGFDKISREKSTHSLALGPFVLV